MVAECFSGECGFCDCCTKTNHYISNTDPNEEISYNETEALELIKNSTVFDQFITDCMQDYEKFTIENKEQEIKNLKSSSPTT